MKKIKSVFVLIILSLTLAACGQQEIVLQYSDEPNKKTIQNDKKEEKKEVLIKLNNNTSEESQNDNIHDNISKENVYVAFKDSYQYIELDEDIQFMLKGIVYHKLFKELIVEDPVMVDFKDYDADPHIIDEYFSTVVGPNGYICYKQPEYRYYFVIEDGNEIEVTLQEDEKFIDSMENVYVFLKETISQKEDMLTIDYGSETVNQGYCGIIISEKDYINLNEKTL